MMVSTARQPPRVAPGDRVGVAALSGPVDQRALRSGFEALEAFGLRPVPAANLRLHDGLFAGDEAARLGAFHELVADASLKAILFARGGHGVLPLLPKLNWDLLAERPRLYCGYSDVTPFLVQVVKRLELVALYGPMVAKDFARGLSAIEESALWAGMTGEAFDFPLDDGPEEPIEGLLAGGCLSLLTACAGTPYAPDLTGSILFLEDVQEPLYRIDRMLHQLRLAKLLGGVRAIVFGSMSPLASEDAQAWRDGWKELVAEWSGRLEIPIATGLPVGHQEPNLALPLGRAARLSPQGRLEVAAA
jgi:muramoyltetrapeptide carboxypeptidase